MNAPEQDELAAGLPGHYEEVTGKPVIATKMKRDIAN